MPWEVKKIGNPSKPYCVVKEGTEDIVSCHKKSIDAQKHQAALYANTGEESRRSS